MTLLADVLDPAELALAVEKGLVRTQRHPSRPFVMYNYTEACQYTAAWTPVTLACRGLVVDADGRIVARPFAKFFNHSESHAPRFDPVAAVVVTDKSDELTAPLPDEFHAWVRAVARELTAAVDARAAAIEAVYAAIVADLPDGWGRKEFAARAVRSEHKFALFLRLDGKDYRPVLWQHARPAADLNVHGTKVTEE
jgi:RNA ligase